MNDGEKKTLVAKMRNGETIEQKKEEKKSRGKTVKKIESFLT